MSQPHPQVQPANYAVPPEAAGWQKRYLTIGVLAAVATIVGLFMQSEQAMRGYLIGYMLWLGLSLGCLALLMVQHLSGGLWGLSIRRILEAATRGLPLMLVLWIPLVLGRHYLYHWMDGEGISQNNSWYLNMPFWWLRQAIYFVAWLGLMFILNKRSALQDEPGNRPRFQLISGIGILIYALTISFAAVDWVMSLDPHWGSTIYGMIFIVGQGLSALSFCIIMLAVLTRYSPMREIIMAEQFHDIAKLMLAFV